MPTAARKPTAKTASRKKAPVRKAPDKKATVAEAQSAIQEALARESAAAAPAEDKPEDISRPVAVGEDAAPKRDAPAKSSEAQTRGDVVYVSTGPEYTRFTLILGADLRIAASFSGANNSLTLRVPVEHEARADRHHFVRNGRFKKAAE